MALSLNDSYLSTYPSLSNYFTDSKLQYIQPLPTLMKQSDTQKEVSRLLNQAFHSEPRLISPEVKVGMYSIDMVLDLKQRGLFNLALDITNHKSKYFRSEYPSVASRIRTKVLRKNGFKVIEIDT